jgi:tetratricopeptide (TPR) repeat protein
VRRPQQSQLRARLLRARPRLSREARLRSGNQRLQPSDPARRTQRAAARQSCIAWRIKGDLERAIVDFDAAIKLDPKLAVAYHDRGTAYGLRGDNDRAIADFTAAIKLDPKNAVAFNNRGFAYRNKGETDKALADFSDAIGLDPKYQVAYFNPIAFYDRHEFDRALAGRDADVFTPPSYSVSFDNRGVSYESRRETARSRSRPRPRAPRLPGMLHRPCRRT